VNRKQIVDPDKTKTSPEGGDRQIQRMAELPKDFYILKAVRPLFFVEFLHPPLFLSSSRKKNGRF
jgi:hypothetical protein